MNFSYDLTNFGESALIISIHQNPLIVGNYQVLEICLGADIRDDERTLTWIDDVLNGKKEKDYVGADITTADFDKDTTVVHYEELTTSNPAKCTLPTWLFREIVEVWLKEAKKHFEARMKAEE